MILPSVFLTQHPFFAIRDRRSRTTLLRGSPPPRGPPLLAPLALDQLVQFVHELAQDVRLVALGGVAVRPGRNQDPPAPLR